MEKNNNENPIRCTNVKNGHICNRLLAIQKSEKLIGQIDFKCARCKNFVITIDGEIK